MLPGAAGTGAALKGNRSRGGTWGERTNQLTVSRVIRWDGTSAHALYYPPNYIMYTQNSRLLIIFSTETHYEDKSVDSQSCDLRLTDMPMTINLH